MMQILTQRRDECVDPIGSEDPLHQHNTHDKAEKVLQLLVGQVVHDEGEGVDQEEAQGILRYNRARMITS